MTACPLCGAAWTEYQSTCECGYDVLLVEAAEQEQKTWRVTFNLFGAMTLSGIVLTGLFPALGISAGLATIGVAGGVWAATKLRSSKRRLRDIATPKQLPAARVKQLPAAKQS